MEMGINLTMYDLVIIILFVLLVGRGIWVGFLKQIIVLLSLYLGYIVASQYHDRLFPFLKDVSDNPKVIFLTACALLFVVTYILFMLIGKGLNKVVDISIAGWFDRFLGGLLGFAKAAILAILIHMVLGAFLPPENRMLTDCQSCKVLNRAVEVTRNLIKDEEAREALMRQKAAITLEKARKMLEDQSPKDASPIK